MIFSYYLETIGNYSIPHGFLGKYRVINSYLKRLIKVVVNRTSYCIICHSNVIGNCVNTDDNVRTYEHQDTIHSTHK